MREKGYFCLTILSFKGRKSTHSRSEPFFFRTGTTRAQYGELLYLIMFLLSRSSVISLICSFSDHAKRLGAYG